MGRLAGLRRRLGRVWHHVELDEWPKVLCHNDTYAVNWIAVSLALFLLGAALLGSARRSTCAYTLPG